MTTPQAVLNHPNTQPHKPKAITHDTSINALLHLIRRLEANLTPPANPAEQWWSYIPLPLDHWFENMATIRQTLGPGTHQYLELGSGIGTKLALANELGYHTLGIEHHQPYIDTSRRIFPHCHVIHSDAANPNHNLQPQYQNADIIYNYALATNAEDHHRINRNITKHMKPEALYYQPRPPHPTWLEHIHGHVWRKP